MIQPGDGVEPLLKGIKKAKKTIDIVVFRFDRPELERALVDAVERGVAVHALIAFTNRGGEKNLRKLESHFLSHGITVARTAGDLVRYHGKMMLVDRKELYVLGFNFTHLDIDHSRSFGIVTRNRKLVQEASALFEADCTRQLYKPGSTRFLVSPLNARKQLAAFIKGAKRELLIYDPKVSDRAMLRLLLERQHQGVSIRVVGKCTSRKLMARELGRMRLHTRTIIRDGDQAFLGSQSLRQLELDSRREIGVIFRDAKIVRALTRTFEEDWVASEIEKPAPQKLPVEKAAKKLAKAVSKKVELEPVVAHVSELLQEKTRKDIHPQELGEAVREAVKEALAQNVREAAEEVVKDVVEEVA